MCNDPVLFVDDDFISRLLNCAILRECGFVVVEAGSYAEACIELERHPRLTALVTDVDLGAGPDGFHIARQARDGDPQLPVLYISGTDVARYAKEGVCNSHFMPKPFDPNHVVTALDYATSLAPTQRDHAPPASL